MVKGKTIQQESLQELNTAHDVLLIKLNNIKEDRTDTRETAKGEESQRSLDL